MPTCPVSIQLPLCYTDAYHKYWHIGMKEELNMFGTEFNVPLLSCIHQPTCSTLLGRKSTQYSPVAILSAWYRVRTPIRVNYANLPRLPDNLMLQVVAPRIWFPLMQIIWGVLTFWWVRLLSFHYTRSFNELRTQHVCYTQCSTGASWNPPWTSTQIFKVYAIRFLQGQWFELCPGTVVDWPSSLLGIAESSTFVGTHYILGS